MILEEKNKNINDQIIRHCSKCNQYKSINNFGKNNSMRDGLSWWCKECNNKRSKIEYINNKDVIDEKHRDYYHTIGGRYCKYKGDAKKRNIIFSLTFNEFEKLFISSCEYCGIENSQGVDRRNNIFGYEINNCVACCSNCNWAKLDLDYEEWNKYLYQISYFFYDKGRIREIFRKRKRLSLSLLSQYHTHLKNCIKRNMCSKLTYEQFCSFYEIPCYYCGSITKIYIGIDRINNDIGYEFNNCVSCCKNCNSGKNYYSIEEWNKWLERIAIKYKIS